jgi:DNA mismatch repair protein MutS
MFPTQLPQDLSLLWPPDFDRSTIKRSRLGDNCVNDLDLESLFIALSSDYCHPQDVRAILLNLCGEPAVIRYRQDIIEDLLAVPGLATRFEAYLPTVASLDQYRYSASPGQTPLHEVIWRIGQLEAYVAAIQGLNSVFAATGAKLRSEALQQLQTLAAQIKHDETFQNLEAELPDLLAKVRSIASVTIGVNLDDHLRPVQATLLTVNNRKFRGASSSLFDVLFGRSAEREEWEGIAQLHSVPQVSSSRQKTPGVDFSNPLMYPLFRDLSNILKQISRPVASVLRRYIAVNIQFLGHLRIELGFYLGAAALIQRLQAYGLPVCRPELAPKDERFSEVDAIYNVQLALRTIEKAQDNGVVQTIVTNDITFGPEGRIFVLTGPNQGGKTTYTQAMGTAHILAQAGLYVPGSRARLSPVDGIYTHFPAEERPDMDAGRLGEEAKRLNDIFAHATRYSLVLLNESLSSTSAGESLYLARDIVRVLRLLGVRAVYATHLHELATDVANLNAETPGDSPIISLVSLVDSNGRQGQDVRQTYKIVPGPPMGRSYAREIASRYGISYDQLTQMLVERGVVDTE